MAQWGTTDNVTSSPLFAPAQLNQAPNTTNRAALYQNATSNAYFAGRTDGVYGISATELASTNASSNADKVAHTGWNLRTVGQGGRAGRVFIECLVAGSITATANETSNATFGDNAIFPET